MGTRTFHASHGCHGDLRTKEIEWCVKDDRPLWLCQLAALTARLQAEQIRADAMEEKALRYDREMGDLAARLRASEHDNAILKQCVDDTAHEMECLPGCDSYAHEEMCPVTNTAVAWRTLVARLQAAEAEVGKLTSSVHALEDAGALGHYFVERARQRCAALEGALDTMRVLWEMALPDLHSLDRARFHVPFGEVHDPIGIINRVLDKPPEPTR